MSNILEGLLFIGLLCCSAFFSATETAFFSLSPLRLKKLEEDGEKWVTDILVVLAEKQRLLISLLLGNTIVNVTATAIATEFIIEFVNASDFIAKSFVGNSPAVAVALASGIMTVLILVFG